MISLIGYNFYGDNDTLFFSSPSPPIRKCYYLELKSHILDEIHIREKTDILPSIPKAVIVDDLNNGIIE